MFTGIIEEIGIIKSISKNSNSAKIEIQAKKILEDVNTGDSICSNGVCLTITSFTEQSFTADVMTETLKSSNLGELKSGSNINLERAATLNTRLGGHLVSGHVDGIGIIEKITDQGIAKLFQIRVDKNIIKYMIHKGSISIDGISLTIQDVNQDSFMVSIIPQTISETNLKYKGIGNTLNIEVDMLMKFTERLMQINNKQSNIDSSYLIKNGFLD
jgi:riboflavin synthase